MSLPLVPAPTHLETRPGNGFVITENTALVAPPGVARYAARLLGLGLDADGDAADTVELALGAQPGEAYTLTVDADRVVIEGSVAGLVRGLATLVQLRNLADGAIPALRIEDAPRFTRRGLMIDVVRHFHGPATLRRVIDLMAAYKLNVLHLHLTDDQGWRFHSASRPELTGLSSDTAVDGAEGGHLSAEDLTALVEYAAQRGIEVVGEIDMPGHSNAALHAVPELNRDGVAPEVYTGTEVGFSQFTLALPATAGFLTDVIGDLAALTPGPYLHVGGDEVHTMERAEYDEFIEAATALTVAAGKTPIVWGEGAVADLPAGALVQLWDTNSDPAPIVAAAQRGIGVILSPAKHVYLDMKYHDDYPLGLAWAGTVGVRDSYDWDPEQYLPGVDPSAIVGVEAALWTETLATEEDLFTMLLPRLAAVAEVAWSAQVVRDWETFAPRLAAHEPLWAAAGYPHEAQTVSPAG
ncbi:beta-N-acetylhexosaminidase [Occultella glacieicola]|uniref:beta-N-acetylhexosaminidase n=1 Tax=Occultella glacieicola TaxID=2518684 RepID=A0ABY2E330_9MICO|nr:family 20 glycosylhydrolase [Occultella glacieicola]TDE94028.1 beta-N-acetylhexosaminidase [Occultella glacieicola]